MSEIHVKICGHLCALYFRSLHTVALKVLYLFCVHRNACEHIWGEELKDMVVARGNTGKFVVYCTIMTVVSYAFI